MTRTRATIAATIASIATTATLALGAGYHEQAERVSVVGKAKRAANTQLLRLPCESTASGTRCADYAILQPGESAQFQTDEVADITGIEVAESKRVIRRGACGEPGTSNGSGALNFVMQIPAPCSTPQQVYISVENPRDVRIVVGVEVTAG